MSVRAHFDEELGQLKEQVLAMAHVAEQAIG